MSIKIKQVIITLLKRFSLYELFKGLAVTLYYMFQPNFTVQFPEEKTPYSPRFRGILALRRYPLVKDALSTQEDEEGGTGFIEQNIDDKGEERCIACQLCEAVCPAMAITIETEVRKKDGQRRTKRFDIDMFKCINCGLCEEACPVDSIVTVRDANYSIWERGQNILTKEKLLEIGEHYESKIAEDREEDSHYR